MDLRTNTAGKPENDPNRRPLRTRRVRCGRAVPCPGDVRAEVGDDHHELAELLVKTDGRNNEK